MTNYEDARQRIERIPVSPEAGSRNVEWITLAEIIGVARDTEGKVELLLRGAELVPVSRTVKDASEHRTIYKDDGTTFEATRLVFPALTHFDQVAAFICIELLRNEQIAISRVRSPSPSRSSSSPSRTSRSQARRSSDLQASCFSWRRYAAEPMTLAWQRSSLVGAAGSDPHATSSLAARGSRSRPRQATLHHTSLRACIRSNATRKATNTDCSC